MKTPMSLFGRAVVYGPWSQPVDGIRFRINRGAYVPDSPVTVYDSHNKHTLLGNTENGTLKFTETDLGLNVQIVLPRTLEARKVFSLIRDDYVTGMSFGMRVIDARKVGRTGNVDDYEVTKFALTEVSPTPKPSFPGTSISVRDEIRPGRDAIVLAAQSAITSDLRKRTAARQLQQATIGMRLSA
jgi:HK97 family phage prohead protease